MANRRASEQFAWDQRKEKRLKSFVAAGTNKQTMAQLLGTNVSTVSKKIDELNLHGPKVRWDERPRSDRMVQP